MFPSLLGPPETVARSAFVTLVNPDGRPTVLQMVLETETQTLALSVTRLEDLEAMVSHMTTSLRRIFPDSCPG